MWWVLLWFFSKLVRAGEGPRSVPVTFHLAYTQLEGVHSRSGHPYGAAMVLTIVLALCLAMPPVDGPVVGAFAPSPEYAGHWGVDIAAPPGSIVRAPDGGVVTFAGTVAGTNSVTIRVSHDVRVSLSYLSSIEVPTGSMVAAGTVVGRSGLAHGDSAVHLSVRIGNEYVDPIGYLKCRRGTIRLLFDR